MPDTTEPVRAPQGAVAWHPTAGWIYHPADIPTDLAGFYVLVVTDGEVRDITASTTAPLAAVLRIDADLSELVGRVSDLPVDTGSRAVAEVDDVRMKVLASAERLAQELSRPAGSVPE